MIINLQNYKKERKKNYSKNTYLALKKISKQVKLKIYLPVQIKHFLFLPNKQAKNLCDIDPHCKNIYNSNGRALKTNLLRKMEPYFNSIKIIMIMHNTIKLQKQFLSLISNI